MNNSRKLRAHKQALERERLELEANYALTVRQIREADAQIQKNLSSIDALLDRSESDLRHVIGVILGNNPQALRRFHDGAESDLRYALRNTPQTLHRMQRYLCVIQRAPSPSPEESRPKKRVKYNYFVTPKRVENPAIDAILKAPEDELRALIKVALLADDSLVDLAWRILQNHLLPQGVGSTEETKSQYNLNPIPRATDAKPKRAALLDDASFCDKCDSIFLESENGAEACVYHPRKIEVNEQSDDWVYWDEAKHGDKSYADHDEKPDGFWYPCCEITLLNETPGCKRERHWARDDRRGPHAWMDGVVDASPRATDVNPDPAALAAWLADDPHFCNKCKTSFLESENGAKVCVYHPRDVEVVEDGDWDDFNPKNGLKCEVSEEENPGWFWYPCCETSPDNVTPGCKRERHWAIGDPRGPLA